MVTRIANPSVVVNNNPIGIVPNTVKYTEGQGEQNFAIQSSGGNEKQTVYSKNVESQFSKVMFDMYNTAENIALIREWKTNLDQNSITITGDNFSRSFDGAALISDYEVGLGADDAISLEFHTQSAI